MSLQESGIFVNKKWLRSAYSRQDRLLGHGPLSDNNGLGPGDVDHRGSDACFQRPGIYHQVQLVDQHLVQLVDAMAPPPTGQVGTGAGDGSAECRNQGHCDRVPGQPDADLSGAGRQVGWESGKRFKDDCHLPRPESVHEPFRRRRHLGRQVEDDFVVRYQDQQGLVGRPHFDGKNPVDRVGIQGVRSQAIEGTGRKRDHPPAFKDSDRRVDQVGLGVQRVDRADLRCNFQVSALFLRPWPPTPPCD